MLQVRDRLYWSETNMENVGICRKKSAITEKKLDQYRKVGQ